MKTRIARSPRAALALARSPAAPRRQAGPARARGRPRASRCPQPKTFTLDNGLARHARPVRHGPQGHRPPGRPDRQRRRGRQRGLARGPDGRHAVARARPRAAPRRSPRTRRSMGGSLDITRRREPHRDRRRRALGVRPRDGRARRRRRAAPEVPRVGARAAARPTGCASSRSPGASRSRSPRRSSAPCSTATIPTGASSRPRRCSRATRSPRSRDFYETQLRRRALAPLRRRPLRRGRDGGRHPQGLRRLEARRRPEHLAQPAPKSERAVYLIDRPGAVQSTINLGMPVIDPVEARLGPPLRHERAARRLVLLAHHVEHPRAEGLHVLAARRSSPTATATRTGSRSPTSRPT